MAKVGLEHVVSALLTEDEQTGAASYTKGRYWGPSSQVNLTTNSNNIVDYGDDGAVESDKSLSTIGLTVELNETTNELEAELLGHKIVDGVLKATTDDVAPWVGLGFIGKSKRNNEYVMTAVFLFKCQFAAPNNENSTKQESTSFNHTTFEGSAYPLKNHDLYESKEFTGDTALEDAKAWLDAKVNLATA